MVKVIEKITRDLDWNNIPSGSKFTANILKQKCSGRIFKEGGTIHFCQNTHCGDNCSNKLGFKYSWSIDSCVTNIKIYLEDTKIYPPILDWNSIPNGTKFVAKIDGKELEGRIMKDKDYVYFCNDEVSGRTSPNLLGYKASRCVPFMSNMTGSPEGIELISLSLDPDFVIPDKLFIHGYLVQFLNDYVKIGCKKILHSDLLRLKAELNNFFIPINGGPSSIYIDEFIVDGFTIKREDFNKVIERLTS